MSTHLHLKQVSLQIGQRTILDCITLTLEPGDYCCIVGPNGAGKSSLLKILMGIVPASGGTVTIGNQSLLAMSQKQRARLISYVPQHHNSLLPFTVDAFLRMSRYAHHPRLAVWTPDDTQALEQAIAVTAIEPFLSRQMATLSGGERQRVMIAAAVCQQSPIMLLDEPAHFLDPHHQAAIHHLIRDLNQHHAMTILEVSHDINHAAHHSQQILAIKQGRTYWFGAADTFLEPSRLQQLYEQPFVLSIHPQTGQTLALFSELES